MNWLKIHSFTRYSVHMEDLDAWWFKNFPCKQSTDIENISASPKYYPMPCEGFVNEDLITSHLHTKKTQIVEDSSSSKSQGMAIVLLNS